MLKYTHIPLMYHPTNVMILDDDPRFSNDICMLLEQDIPYEESTDPDKILQYLQKNTYHPDALSALVVKQTFENNDPGDNTETFAIQFSKLRETLVTPDRFRKASVALIDRRMRKVDGLEFCDTLRKFGFLLKLVLYTGKTTHQEAVDAFNRLRIDGFIVKQTKPEECADEINSTVRNYMWQFFVDLGQSFTALLSHILKPLHDKQFIQVFEKIRQLYKIIEFYLLDSSCSFLLINADGKPKHFFVRSEQDFKDCYEIAKDAEAPNSVLQALRDRQQFPYTQEDMGYAHFKGDVWEEVMVSMDRVPGRDLYYAVVDGYPGIEVFSFNRYSKEVWPW